MSAWRFPIGMVDTLAYPNETSIIFTDSIPLFAVFFKLLSPILPSNFQYFGIWGILCFILQGVFAARIIKNFANNRVIIISASTLFAYAPIMIWRMYVHTALAGQWILLLGLEPIFTHEKYDNNRRIYIITALMGLISSAVHLYFALMSGVILVGICLEDILINKRIKRTLYLLGLYIFSVAIVVGLLGGFSSGMQAVNGGLGAFSFNINGFFNPQGWSSIFKDLSLYGSGQYEGFGYLGAGCILMLIISLFLLISKKDLKMFFSAHWTEILPIGIVLIISVVIACSPVVALNDHIVLSMNLPESVIMIWSVFRASGRIVWTAVYIIMLCSCILLCKLADKKTAILVLAAVLIIQVYDIHDVLLQENDYFSVKQEFISDLSSDDFWKTISDNKEIKHVVYYSGVDQSFMYSLTDWAMDNNLTVNNFYFARSIDNLVNECTQTSLSILSKDSIFIFQLSNKMDCLKYNLHYYEVDGVIVGYSKKISSFTGLPKSYFCDSWNFGDNQYIDETSGLDTDAGRIIFAGGLSYGPYWSVPAGQYTIEITGVDMPDNLDVMIYSEHGEVCHDYKMTDRNDSEIEILIDLPADVSDLEICLKNNSDVSVNVKGINLNYVR